MLEVGCGTGRVALHLAQHGVRVVGIDLSPAMLERAQRRAAELGLGAEQVGWQRGDVRRLALGEQFGLCTLAFSTFAHLLTQDDQLAALERVAAHLKPGGGLALDMPNPIPDYRAEDASGLVFERAFTDPETGHTVMQQSLAALDRAAQILEVTWVYDELAPDGALRRTLVPVRYRHTFAQEARLLLRLAGFGAVEVYGDYDFSPYHEDSPRLFVVAERAAETRSAAP